jgi:hypothetical protein
MIFAFIEDGTLEVHEDLASVQKAFEGLDVESGVVAFYDATGTYLEPYFTVPNQSRKIFGLVLWVTSGVYTLVPNPHTDEDPFALALYETHTLAPNRWFTSLDHLKSELAAQGIAVEYRPGSGSRRE